MPQTPDFRVDVVERNPYRDLFPTDRAIFPGGGFGKNYEREPVPRYENRGRPEDEAQPPTDGTTTDETEKPKDTLGGGSGFNLSALLKLLAGLGLTATGMASQPKTTTPTTTDAALAEMLKLQQGRLTKSEPLYDAILRMAGGLMPTQYQPTWPAASALPTVDNTAQTRVGQSNPGGAGIDLDGKRRG